MTAPSSSSGAPKLPALAMMAGAMTGSLSGAMTFGQISPTLAINAQGQAMTPQEQEIILAKVDLRMADLKGDVRLNTQGLADLKERFNDLANKVANVPTDIAAMKTQIMSLPDKDWVSAKLRNNIIIAGVIFSMLGGLITWGPRLVRAISVAAS